MTKRCIIWGLETPHTSSALLELQETRVIDICAWFGVKSRGSFVSHHIYDFQGRSREIQRTPYRSVPQTAHNQLLAKAMAQLLEVTSRSYQTNVKSFQDLIDILSCQLNYLESLLADLKPDLILFHNVPHEGPDLILYELAIAHDVATLICTQSLFENRFFMIKRIEDIGKFDPKHYDKQYQAPTIVRTFEKEYFYIPNLTPQQRISQSIIKFLQLSKIIFAPFALFGFTKSRRYFYRFFYWLDFVKNKKMIANNYIRWTDKFVYFPLHLQPEMTTATLGGVYCDQLLAIERLRDLIPSEWKIIVKENPKQTYFRRGKHFFERLCRIQNVQYCTEGNTHKLIENSQFLATISGSAGWEALCGGKNVLLFGNSWYQNLPGAFKFSNTLQLTSLTNDPVDLADLQNAFNQLMSSSFSGIVDPAYVVMLANYDLNKNNDFIKKAIASYIHKI